jgi:diguanylate cyclase (GGDEF)-like protein
MTIRKKILLFSALALGAFLAAVYLASRFALLNGFSRLEKNYARENVHRLQSELENEQAQLATMSRDYAQWDRTYDFMKTGNMEYVRAELTDDTFNVMRIDVLVLLDQSGRVVFHKSMGGGSLQGKGLDEIAAAHQPGESRRAEVGIIEINGQPFLVAYEPILTSRGAGEPRGTLVMGRRVSTALLATLSKSAGFPIWLESSNHVSEDPAMWSDGANSVFLEGDSMVACVPIRDFSGRVVRFLVARIPSDLNSEANKVMRYLLLLLMLAGVVHCGVLLLVLEGNLLARVAALNTKIQQVTVSGDLSLRLSTAGNDELSALAGAMNAMLEGVHRAKAELLQAQESLRFHAEHDSLTGVLNRRAIRDVLRKELARCRRENQTLGVIVADVDHFKAINDHYGHGAGDAALVAVVQRISATLRPYDVIGRYGGEEFLIIAPGCDFGLTQKLAERVRSAVSDELVDLGNESVTITVSLGATLGSAESDPEFLVAVADAAMYEAKRNGRNRVETNRSIREAELEGRTSRR